MSQAILWQRVEAAIIFVVGLALFRHWNDAMEWWAALLIFFAPDLSFFGYLWGPKVGAAVYNVLHVYAVGAAMVALGVILPLHDLTLVGALWLAHSGFDRMLGYGLKLPDGFAFTHLGRIGKQDQRRS
jgi:hypothetical protein